MYKYYLVYKPYNVLSQFTEESIGDRTLAEFNIPEKDVYSVGRLDKDSEGLLLLTNDNKFKNAIIHSENEIWKTYYCQLEGVIDDLALSKLKSPLTIKVKNATFTTKPSNVRIIHNANIPERIPSIRIRADKPTSWIEIKICEGKNRQIRKMLAHVGYPVLRLIRVGVGNLMLTFPIEFNKKLLAKSELDLIFRK